MLIDWLSWVALQMYHLCKRLHVRAVTIIVEFETSDLRSGKNLYFCNKDVTKMKNRLILFALLSAFVQTAFAQTSRLYTSEMGLPNSQINRICQDRRGYIWMCSEGGLIRFDGMRFETYRHDRGNGRSRVSRLQTVCISSPHVILTSTRGRYFSISIFQEQQRAPWLIRSRTRVLTPFSLPVS